MLSCCKHREEWTGPPGCMDFINYENRAGRALLGIALCLNKVFPGLTTDRELAIGNYLLVHAGYSEARRSSHPRCRAYYKIESP